MHDKETILCKVVKWPFLIFTLRFFTTIRKILIPDLLQCCLFLGILLPKPRNTIGSYTCQTNWLTISDNGEYSCRLVPWKWDGSQATSVLLPPMTCMPSGYGDISVFEKNRLNVCSGTSFQSFSLILFLNCSFIATKCVFKNSKGCAQRLRRYINSW